MVYVNYHRERRALEALVASQVPARRTTLFVNGPKQFGKTELLQWFKDTHGSTKQVCYIDVADPAAAVTPRAAMSTFVADLNGQGFEEYWALENKVSASIAIIKDVHLEGSHNVIEASSGVAIPDQLANLLPLTRAFLAGVAATSSSDRPIILCIDGYGATETLTKLWIRRQLVRFMPGQANAYLILASREPPDQEIIVEDRNLQTVELRGIHDVEEWLAAARELRCRLPVESEDDAAVAIRVMIDYLKGQPGDIMRWLRGMAAL